MPTGIPPASRPHGTDALRFTFTIEAGKATKVTLLQGGATIDGPRDP
jgi:hypothetical protein